MSSASKSSASMIAPRRADQVLDADFAHLTLQAPSEMRDAKEVNGSRILVLGVAYKRDIDDVRESPALAIIEQLRKRGGEVSYHDPYIPEILLDGDSEEKLRSVDLSENVVRESDCVIIVTDHHKIDYRKIAEQAQLVVDTRNATGELKDPALLEKIIRL